MVVVASRPTIKLAAEKPVLLGKREQLRIARALADPTRFEIFQQIAAGRCVACADLREHLSVTPPTVSHHLKELEAANLIEMARDGKFMNLTFRRDIWQAYLKELSRI
ncbi:transcriptional regulator, ArsR family [Acidisarcina polymorpha]|uniref:Transcriptional regulator, ArsR family n=1 Tax=Acidisarcina polymorpha TaxID=2211140 RepID=A0A2Z5FVN5_9BACT|nr:helix-turn-helix domain-containing protein [Acidisarcina polymorpha]AXC10911.1 transcriptional regulator, ArsR family [Acidisarcina polymorpha]